MATSSSVKSGSHKSNGNASRSAGLNGNAGTHGNGSAHGNGLNGSANGGSAVAGVKSGVSTRSGAPIRVAASARAKELPLRGHTERALQEYFASLNGHRPARLYDMVLHEVEEPLFRAVLDYAAGNQSRAAGILGINRGTLRKKLRALGLSD
jgi:Fis family transcriptional regulator